ncbi:hypothetical protein BDZ89DRAFT_1145922 [Hymenopellis radicata]|nr:hypothetical protein BDZ89DRAFT_1145922 [Hymenopellis radicata]
MPAAPIDKKKLAAVLAAAVPIITAPILRPPALSVAPALITTVLDPDSDAGDSVLLEQIRADPLLVAVEADRQAAVADNPKVIPRPTQDGQRITDEWLQSRTDEDLRYRFGMVYQEIHEMVDSLGIPDFRTRNNYVCDSLEAFCLLCARFRSSGNLYDLTIQYNRSISALSEIINDIVEFLDDDWEHLLAYDNEHLLHPSRLLEYADAIRLRGAPTTNVFAFIDCTIRRIARPTWYQRVAYNGHKKFHALKFQARNDNALLSDSGILERLAEFAFPEEVDEDAPLEEQSFQIFGDPAYGLSRHMLSPFAGEGERTAVEEHFNAQMASVRIEVEHGFGIVANTWPYLNAGWKHRLYASPVGRYYRVGVLLTNCLNCLRPNQVAQYFNCQPPSLRDYLHAKD